jgi:hypothetical protein
MKPIGIVIIATNAYFVLGIRFIKKFMYHYKGDCKIKFFFFSDESPHQYLPDNIDVHYVHQIHTNWTDGTNSKFKNIIELENSLTDVNYVYYFDADTNVNHPFTEEWFLGDLVGGEHFGNRGFLKDCVGYDKNPLSKAYVPKDTNLPCTYYYGAFFGGKTERVLNFCKTLYEYQQEDKKIGYEPGVNDESYINHYFHYTPPTYTVPTEKFQFGISDKGGIGDTRKSSLDVNHHKNELRKYPDKLFDINADKVVWE